MREQDFTYVSDLRLGRVPIRAAQSERSKTPPLNIPQKTLGGNLLDRVFAADPRRKSAIDLVVDHRLFSQHIHPALLLDVR